MILARNVHKHRCRIGRRLGLTNGINAPPTAQCFDQQHTGIHVPVQDADAG